MGTNGFASSSVPVAVDTSGVLVGRTVTAIAAGFFHSCAVADGRAYCWGYNRYGQLGNNSATDSSVPVAVDTSGVLAGKTVTAIADGRVPLLCGGRRPGLLLGRQLLRGQLGNNSTTDSSVPVAVDTSGVLADKTVTAIAAGPHSTCAVANGKAYCWGEGGAGQLGHNSTWSRRCRSR